MRKIIKTVLSAVIALQVGFFLPMQQARADIVNDVIKLISDAAGWPPDLPPVDALLALVDVAQKCTGDTSMDGLIDCVEIADANPDIHNKLGDDFGKIKYGLELFRDITTGNYLGVLDKLGATIGCAAAVMITGVPVCAMAQLIADLAGTIAEAAEEIYAFLKDLGTHAVVQPQDYYQFHWSPKVSLGVQINVFAPNWDSLSKEFGALTGPLYDVCYDFYKDNQDWKEKPATDNCENLQQQFVNEVNSEVAKLENSAKALILAAYDAKSIQWRKDWAPKCELTSGAAANIENLIDTCNQKVAAAIESGKSVIAIPLVKSCRIPDTLTYDTQNCAESVYKNNKNVINGLLAAVKDNQKLESDFQNNPNSAKAALAKLKYLIEKSNNELSSWFAQCKFDGLSPTCHDGLKQAWDVCNEQIAKVPSNDLGPDPDKLQKVQSQCAASYSALITAYTKFVDKRKLMAVLTNSCPKDGQSSGPLFAAASAQCAKDVNMAATKCAGGQPQITAAFYATGKTTQTPAALDDCSGEISFFNGKWGIAAPLYEKLFVAFHTAGTACTPSGLPGCIEAVKAKADECKASIGNQANAVGIIPGAPSFQSELDKAIKDLIASGNNCIQALLKVPEKYLKSNAAEVIVLQGYGKQCPPDIGKMDYAQQCKTDLLKTIDDCTRLSANPTVRSGGTLAEQQVADCKLQLKAVIDKYQKQYSAFVDPAKAGAAAPPAASQTQGLSKPVVLAGPSATTPPKAAASPPVTIPGTQGSGASAGASLAASKTTGISSPGTLAGPASSPPAKPGKPDPALYTQQRKPLLEAPWLSRCTSNACRNEVVRLIGNRISDELGALGARVNPADVRAIDALYGELDLKYREPLNLALKKSDAATAAKPAIVLPR